MRSARSRGMKNTSAGPPTCQEVWRDSGSPKRTREANSGGSVKVMPHPRSAAHAPAAPASSCATALMLPAPIIAITSPGRSRPASAVGDLAPPAARTPARPCRGRAPRGRWRAPSAPSMGASPAAYTSVTSSVSACDSTRAKSSIRSRVRVIAMRLEHQHDAAARVGLAQRIERRGDLGGVMAVVIDDGDARRIRQAQLAHHLQAPVDALEAGQRALDGRVVDAQGRWPRRWPPANSARCAARAGSR